MGLDINAVQLLLVARQRGADFGEAITPGRQDLNVYGSWHGASDPESIKARVELITFAPIQLLVQALCTRVVPLFATPPPQSGCTKRWTDQRGGKPAVADTTDYSLSRPKLAKALPGVARLLNVLKIGFGLLRSHSLMNRKSFRPVKKP